MHYLIAYDIADPRRLRRVARACERAALRCQKSVFLLRGGEERLRALLQELAALIDPRADVVQAWLLGERQPPLGQVRGRPAHVYPAAVVLGDTTPYVIAAPDGRLPSRYPDHAR